MCSAAYKKQGTPDQRPLFSYLTLFACAASHTKSKELPIDAPYNFYYFYHA
jgi:hypothetical protein